VLVLVTGAAGFIGSHLVDRLLAAGHEVVGIDDMSTGGHWREDIDFHRLDVTDPALVALAAERRPEVICHLAAQVSVRASVRGPLHDGRVNALGTVNVLEAACAGGARKVVNTSSCAVYGVPDELPVPADAELRPASPYAASKVCAEIYTRMYRTLHGLDCTTLTLANVYGPRQSPEGEAGVVSLFTDALLHGTATQIYGDGTNTRDYVYVLDVVDAFVRACGDRGGGRRFNVGTGVQTTDTELHSLIAEVVGAPDEPRYTAPRLGDLRAMAIASGPTREELGWEPSTTLREGLTATVEWARSR
jgi:UDP-glucose 4-epimerase